MIFGDDLFGLLLTLYLLFYKNNKFPALDGMFVFVTHILFVILQKLLLLFTGLEITCLFLTV